MSAHGSIEGAAAPAAEEAPGKFDLNDWSMANGSPVGLLEALDGATAFVGATHPATASTGPSATPPGDIPAPGDLVNGRPIMYAGGDLNELAQAVKDRILSLNDPPALFLREGELTRLVALADRPPKLSRVDVATVHAQAIDSATWLRVSEKGEAKASKPPSDISIMLHRMPDQRLFPIEQVVSAPFFTRNGSLASTNGYHREGQAYLHLNGLQVPSIPESPTNDHIAAARAALEEIALDFPFARPSDRAQFFASLLLPFARPLIDGSTPIALVEAPSNGAGKSLLSDCLALVATGHRGAATTLGRDEESNEKRITSILLEGPALIVIDNVSDRVASPSLAAAITADRWKQRLLGSNEMASLPNRASWIMTGTNPNLSREVMRRCIRVRIDPQMEKPEERTGFKHPDLRAYVASARGSLVGACLTLVRAWLARGRPEPQAKPLGSFEAWTRVVGGIVALAGWGGLLEDREEMYQAGDAEGAAWHAFAESWYAGHGEQGVTPSTLLPLAAEHLGDVVGDGNAKSQASRLGRALVRMRDKFFGNLRLKHTGDKTHPAWRLVLVAQAPPAIPNEGEAQDEPGSLG
jgi:putative DNA primase/helicase